MRFTLLIILFVFMPWLSGQVPVGQWTDHLPYTNAKYVVSNADRVFACTDYALTIYDKNDGEVKKMSKVNGLSECGIKTIAYSDEYNSLIIAFTSTNIDLVNENTVLNIPDILNKYISGRKEINRVRVNGRYAYIATSFGIVLLDLVKHEIRDTWKPSVNGSGNNVSDLCFSDDKVFAVTDQGLFYAISSAEGLSFFGNWSIVPGAGPGDRISEIASFGEKVVYNCTGTSQSGDTIYVLDNLTPAFFYNNPGISNRSIEIRDNLLIISSGSSVSLIDQFGSLQANLNSLGWSGLNANNAITDGDDIYIADGSFGLVKGNNMTDFTSLVPPGPWFNHASSIYSESGEVYVSGGLLDNAWNNTWRTFEMHFFTQRNWETIINPDSWDVMRIRPFPGNSSRKFISTWGSGVYEYIGNQEVNHWDDSNSPLQTIIPGKKYVRICGLAFDRDNNLWMTQTQVEGSIKVLKPDGSWVVLPYTIEAPTIGDIIITSRGQKWIVLPRGHGLFVLDDNNTPEQFSDDQYKKINVKDQDGNPLPNVYSIAEDIEGNIWIGTDQGPAVFYNPLSVFTDDIRAYRVKIPRNDGTGLADYLLETEIITSLAVDGGNRKWLGTNSSGVFLVSADGRELIKNYNESNSPVLSNNITDIEVNDKDGEVWIGTDKGIVTVRELATAGVEKMTNVYAFPNPVRHDWTGDVTITGLSPESNVKITDISGNLVFETTSVGGQASWNLKGYDNQRVSTGVYLIFSTSRDRQDTFVSKLLIIR